MKGSGETVYIRTMQSHLLVIIPIPLDRMQCGSISPVFTSWPLTLQDLMKKLYMFLLHPDSKPPSRLPRQ